MMVVLHADLDNTIIYSYKHDIGPAKRNVESYQGREISYITERTHELLNIVKEQMLIVPTSTRTMEQYQRIDLGIGSFPYALVCNGGILLADGKRDEAWYQRSLDLGRPSAGEIQKALRSLDEEPRRNFELRFLEKLFVFTKCDDPELVVEKLESRLDLELVDVFHNGSKVYVLPKALDKGTAIRRFREKLDPEYVIAAGDSAFDISMVETADKGLVPFGFREKYGIETDICEMDGEKLFSESLLEACIKIYSAPQRSAVIKHS